MANIQRRKTEMVGSLVVDADMMSQEAATPESTKKIIQDTAEVVEHLGEDVKRSVNLQKRKTEMYGTLIVDADTMEHSAPPATPKSPSDGDGGSSRRKWSDPMDEVSGKWMPELGIDEAFFFSHTVVCLLFSGQQMIEDMQYILYGL